MISLLVFYVHVVAAATAFANRWQEENWKEGILAIGLMALIFSVGWSISALIVGLFLKKEGFGIWLDRDDVSLLLLTILEGTFYLYQTQKKGSLHPSN